jgi:dihydroorotate dehydrogenase (NAD+) catalytic subunit
METHALNNLPRYNPRRSYAWNYDHPPEPVELDLAPVEGTWSFCGLPVPSPLGIPAGPLLNGAWLLYYASLGFDVLTYKTVRSSARACYPLPNLQPVVFDGMLRGGESAIPVSATMRGSWAVSFGMPSQPPDVWRADVQRTRDRLAPEKVLSVSVVGSIEPGWSIEDLAADYAQCAKWAVDSGADCVETNFSCPNVNTCDGQLYLQPDAARCIAEAVRQAVGRTPYIIKIGHVTDDAAMSALITAVHPYADGLAMTNSVAATVAADGADLLFGGDPRGICGLATRDAALEQVERFRQEIIEQRAELEIIGVGGIGSADDVRAHLRAGAASVHIATAAMVDPLIGEKIRRAFGSESR